MQVENILLGDHGTIKLCDFGSATTKTHLPDPSWSAIQRSLVEDEATAVDCFFANILPLLCNYVNDIMSPALFKTVLHWISLVWVTFGRSVLIGFS